jgi:hypothetical protein
MKKIILWSIVSLVIAGIAVDAYLWLHKPQVILLKDGTKLTLIGVTCGKHHEPPAVKSKTGARQNLAGSMSFDTTNDTLVVWILLEHKANQWPNYQLFVYDQAETACVGNLGRNAERPINQSEEISSVQLDAYPRRDRKIILRVGAWNNMGGGMQVAKGQFVISNPARVQSFARWTPEPVPDTQSDGDLNVTLARLIYGVRGFNNSSGSTKDDPMNKAVLTAFHCEQKGVTVTNWQAMRIETSDATGNHVQNNSWSTSRDENGDATMTYQYGLWPAESPWKLRAEMSRTSGFDDGETWAVTNVPVRPGTWNDLMNPNMRGSRTDTAVAETTLNGIHLKLFPAILFPAIQITDQNFGNGQRQGGIRVTTKPDLPDGYRLSILATDEQGRALQGWGPNGGGGNGGGNYSEQIQNLRAKALTITVALHKSRFVEFTVNPTKQ